MHKIAVIVLAIGLSASVASADLVVDNNLGTLGIGTQNLVGTTAGAGNEADYYLNTTNPAGNWANEVVYQFAVAQTLLFNLATNSVSGDPDFFLLNSPTTVFDGTKNVAQGDLTSYFLDGAPPDTGVPFIVTPGTYYVTAESFIGFDGSTVPGDATFDVTLSLDAIVAPSAIDLGVIASEGDPIVIDSFGSDFDTELGMYDSDSFLLDSNDDAGGGLQSELDFSGGLAAGQYYFALGGFNTEYADGFGVLPGSSSGNYVVNYPGGSMSGALAADTAEWFTFTVIPEPASLALLALGGLAIIRRSR